MTMKRILYIALLLGFVLYILVSFYILFSESPRPKLLTVLLILCAFAGVFYSADKLIRQ